jgi:hypothetical protein
MTEQILKNREAIFKAFSNLTIFSVVALTKAHIIKNGVIEYNSSLSDITNTIFWY